MKRTVNPKKSSKVKSQRGASPEEIAEQGELLETLENPKYDNQILEIYWFKNDIWVVVVGLNPERFITAYRSRKLRKEFGK